MNLGALGRVVTRVADAVINRRSRQAARVFMTGLAGDVRGAFERQADPVTGTPWPPRKFKGPLPPKKRPLLVKTGLMKEKAIALASSPPPDWTGSRLTVRLIDPFYAKYQNNGTGRIPARRFFAASRATMAAAAQAAGKDIVAAVVGAQQSEGA